MSCRPVISNFEMAPLGIIYEATDVTGQLRTSFAEGTTDAARWFEIDEVHHLERVELVDFVLTLV
jgi:hypothetical protein